MIFIDIYDFFIQKKAEIEKMRLLDPKKKRNISFKLLMRNMYVKFGMIFSLISYLMNASFKPEVEL